MVLFLLNTIYEKMWSFNIRYLLLLLVCIILNWNYTCAQDVSASINTKRSMNIVDNRFISIVIDPLILMSGLNISSSTLNLAKHFSPAFIRIQGFSTPQIRYSDEVHSNKDNFSAVKPTVTSSMWTSLNEWLISANLTPVFALSDRDRVNDAWNPKSAALPLMVMADKMNMTCFWELSNDTPNKSLKQYADDLTSLRHILDAFPGSKNSWGIVGGELGQYPLAPLPAEGAETAHKLLKTIESTVDAVVWSPILNSKLQYPAKVRSGILPNTKNSLAIWTTAPRNTNPSNFEDALIWAKNLGQSAARGYSVIFRQPKINELFELTPAYWVSLFHKNLMGRHVLDIRSINYNNRNNAFIFAHCTKNQINSTKKGGVTVFVVNMENEAINVTAKLLGINLKDMEVQSYVLTSSDEHNSNIYLNGELLTVSDLPDNQFEFMPKCCNINASKSLLLDSPPKSIGFYVIPNANVPTCCCNEHANTHEITENQYENVSESNGEKEAKKIANIDVLAKVIENELLSYEEYIKNPSEWRRLLHSQISEPNNRNVNELSEDVKRVIIERAKQKKALELEEKSKHIKQLLLERARNEETKAKLLSDIEKLKASEVEQAVDELINKNNDDTKLREKRSLVTSNEDLSWMQHEENMNAVPRPTRRIQNNLEQRISLDPVYENEQANTCACRRTGKCNCGKNHTNMFLKQMLQVLNSDQKQVETKIESYEGSNQNNNEEIKEMKNLVNELKSIVTTMKYLDIKNKTNQQPKEEIDDSNEMIKVNLIPKNRMKRNTEENNNDVQEEPTKSVSKKRNIIRKKRAPLLINDLKQLENEIIKANATVKPEEEKTEIVKPIEEISETVNPKGEEPETVKSKEEKLEENKEKTDNDRPHSAKYKLLQRKLMHQEKLENQIEQYLQKIRQSKAELKNELEKSFTIKQLGAHVKKHVKRDIWDADSDEIADNETNLLIENNTLDTDEQTNETDMLFNEISKEGKNLPNFVKQNEEPTYKLKVKGHPKKRIIKIIKMFENESKQNNMENVTPNRKTTTTTTSSTTAPSTSKENKTEVFYDAHEDTENTTIKTEKASDDGFVDEAFKTLSQCLSDFHRKIIDFLRFLSP